jgi:glycine dehydrogenase
VLQQTERSLQHLICTGQRHAHLLCLKLLRSITLLRRSTTLLRPLQATGFSSMDALIDATVPKSIRRGDAMDMGQYSDGMGESEFLAFFK